MTKKKKIFFIVGAIAVIVALVGIAFFLRGKDKELHKTDGSATYEQAPVLIENVSSGEFVSSETPFFKAEELYTLPLKDNESAYIENIRMENNTIQVLVRIEEINESDVTKKNIVPWYEQPDYFYKNIMSFALLVFDMDGNIVNKIDISDFFDFPIVVLDVLYFPDDDLWKTVYFDIYDARTIYIRDIQGVNPNHYGDIHLVVEDVFSDFDLHGINAMIFPDGSLTISVAPTWGNLGEVFFAFFNPNTLLESGYSLSSSPLEHEANWESSTALDYYYVKTAIRSYVLCSDQTGTYLISQNETFQFVYDANGSRISIPELWLLPSRFFSGNGEVIASNAAGLYGIKPESGVVHSYAEWKDLDLIPGLKTAVPINEDKLFLCQQSLQTKNGVQVNTFYFLKRQETNPNAGKRILRIGGKDIANSLELQQAIFAYNQGSKDVHAEVLDYTYFDGVGEPTALNEKIEDLVTKNPPDVLYDTKGHYRFVSNRKIWKDLLPIMEADADFIKDDYFSNILHLAKREETLPFVFSSYTLSAILMESGGEKDFDWSSYLHVLRDYNDIHWTQTESYKLLPYLSDFFSPILEKPEEEQLLNPFRSIAYQKLLLLDFEINEYDATMQGLVEPSGFDPIDDLAEAMHYVGETNADISTWETAIPSEASQGHTLFEPFGLPFYIHAEIKNAESLNVYSRRLRNENIDTLSLYGYPSMTNAGMLCRPDSVFGIMENTNQEKEAWRFIKILMETNSAGSGISVKRGLAQVELGKIRNDKDKKMLEDALNDIDRMMFVNEDIIQVFFGLNRHDFSPELMGAMGIDIDAIHRFFKKIL